MVTDGMAHARDHLESLPAFGPVPPQIARLAARMRSGVECKDRMHKHKLYSNCFVGKDALAWCTQHTEHNAKEAVVLCNMMIKHKLMYHVDNSQQKLKKTVLYRWGLDLDSFSPSTLEDNLTSARADAGKVGWLWVFPESASSPGTCPPLKQTTTPHTRAKRP